MRLIRLSRRLKKGEIMNSLIKSDELYSVSSNCPQVGDDF